MNQQLKHVRSSDRRTLYVLLLTQIKVCTVLWNFSTLHTLGAIEIYRVRCREEVLCTVLWKKSTFEALPVIEFYGVSLKVHE